MSARGWLSGPPDPPISALGLTIIAAVVAIDQIGKAMAEAKLAAGVAIDLLPILALYRVRNTGIAFSLFSDTGSALIALTLAITGIVLVFWARTREGGRLSAIGFALIVGGAAGNLIDRSRLGEVIDFLLLHIGGTTLFVFNLADVALTIGPALLIAVYLFGERR